MNVYLPIFAFGKEAWMVLFLFLFYFNFIYLFFNRKQFSMHFVDARELGRSVIIFLRGLIQVLLFTIILQIALWC